MCRIAGDAAAAATIPGAAVVAAECVGVDVAATANAIITLKTGTGGSAEAECIIKEPEAMIKLIHGGGAAAAAAAHASSWQP